MILILKHGRIMVEMSTDVIPLYTTRWCKDYLVIKITFDDQHFVYFCTVLELENTIIYR